MRADSMANRADADATRFFVFGYACGMSAICVFYGERVCVHGWTERWYALV